MVTQRTSIRFRLTAMSALSSSCALLLCCAGFLAYEIVAFRGSLVDDLTTDARMLAFNVTSPLLFDDQHAAMSSLEALRAKPHIVSAILTGKDGAEFAVYGTPGPAARAHQASEPRYTFGDNRLLLTVRVQSADSVIGKLTIESSLDGLRDRVRQYLLLTASILVAAVLAAIGIASRLQRRIVQPIMRLTDAALRVSEHADYSVRVGGSGHDELATLARTFDGMLVEIERQHEVLHASEERYRLLFENSPLPTWVYDLDSLAFLAVNDAAVSHYGYSRPEFLRMRVTDIRPPEDVGSFLAATRDRPEVSRVTRVRHRKKDGTIIMVEVSSHTFSFNGRAARLVLANDITASERAAEALRQSEARFARLFDAGIIGIIVADLAGDILVANDAFLDLVGYSREELRRREVRWTEMTPPESRPLDQEALRQLAANGVARPFEKEYLRKDGSRVAVLLGAGMLDDGTYIGFVLDLSERKRLEQVKRDAFELEAQNRRIQEANRLKSQFLANMSHELRTPLNAILGFGELLQEGAVSPDSPQHGEFLGHIVKSGRHLLQLINDVLDLAKVEAGKMEFRPERIDLRLLIGEVTSIVRGIAVEKNIHLSDEVDHGLDHGLVLDPVRLKQVLYNFLSNALKFTPPGGTVTVRARPEGDACFLLEVEDTGPGIQPQDIDRLFVEFQQLDSGAARRHPGTGLGLALTRRLAEAQGGSVGVRSTPGRGSVFHVVLPRRTLATPAMEPAVRQATAPPGSASVLVIEDDPRDQALLAMALSNAGYAVDAVGTGSEALKRCEAQRFDAVCLDLLLPDVGWQEVLTRIRASALNARVPVVVVTVVPDRGAIAGFAVHDFLPKPIDAAALLASLGRAGLRPRQPGSVMVVDDDESSLDLMSAVLAQLGFQSVSMRHGEEALRAATRSPPAAVVLDLLMPGMDGIEFLDRLRSSPVTRDTPVLVWTVKDLNDQERSRLLLSAQAIVRKGHGGLPSLLEDLSRFLPPRPGVPPKR